MYLLIGLSSGYIWVTDTRSNQFLFRVKVLDDGVRRIFSSHVRIVVESEGATEVKSWDQNIDKELSQYNPSNFFMGK